MIFDDIFWRSVIAGCGIAIVAGPLGCFIVWRRMAFLGDTMAHCSLLGIALGFFWEIDLKLGILFVTIAVGLILFLMQTQKKLPNDALLGTLSHASLAIGVILISLIPWIRIDFMSLLFGDILAISIQDIYYIFGFGFIILILFLLLWKPMLSITFDNELAKAEGINTNFIQIIFTLIIATVIALSIKIVGILLVTSLLIIPVSSARQFSKSPEQMACWSAIIGMISVWIGLEASFKFDTPSGPSIVLTTVICFFITNLIGIKRFLK